VSEECNRLQQVNVIVVPGVPIALQRARHYNGSVIDRQAKVKKSYALHVLSLIERSYVPPEQVMLRVTYCYKPPASWSLKKQRAVMGSPKTTMPDLSNLIKFTEDALNGILWKDDRYITGIDAAKIYAEWDGTVIEIYEAVSDYQDYIRVQ